MEEELRPVVGYDNYMISNNGKLLEIGVGFKIFGRKNGINTAHLKNSLGCKKYFLISRLVCEAFIPNPENHLYVKHKDGNKANNNADNLFWSSKRSTRTKK